MSQEAGRKVGFISKMGREKAWNLPDGKSGVLHIAADAYLRVWVG